MSPGFVAMSVLQVLLGTLVPLGAAWLWRRRARANDEGGAGFGLWGFGALVFVLSQAVHLPLNQAIDGVLREPVTALPPAQALIVSALVLGLSAGLCEELSRYAFFHFTGLRKGDGGARTRDRGLMVGLGHGGIEAILFGTVLVAVTLVQLNAIDRAGIDSLGPLDDATRAAVQAQLDGLHEAPWWTPLVGAGERLMVQPFHVAMTMLVLYGSVHRRFRYVLLAILSHTALDAGSVWLMGTYGAMWTELFILSTVPFSVGAIVLVYRAVGAPEKIARDPRITDAQPSGAPLELVLATKIYEGTHPALRQASFVLRPGSRTCLLGPNGAGKTTAIRLALGALTPTDGRVWLFGAAHDDAHLVASKRRVGVVPQQPGMYEDLTVREYLELVRGLYGRGDIDAISRALDLSAMLDRPMAKHSGGQQRRIALAAALLPEPDLLILDEPSAGLDPVAQKAMRALLAKVGEGRTMLLCTHDLEEAEALCDRVVILEAGQVKVDEQIEVLRKKGQRTLRLTASQSVEQVADALRSSGRAPEIDGASVRVPIDGREDAPGILRALLGAGIDVEECTIEEASLEDIFLAAVEAREQGRGFDPEVERDATA